MCFDQKSEQSQIEENPNLSEFERVLCVVRLLRNISVSPQPTMSEGVMTSETTWVVGVCIIEEHFVQRVFLGKR